MPIREATREQPIQSEVPQKIYLKFCSGVARANIPAGHIWKAVTKAQWTAKESVAIQENI